MWTGVIVNLADKGAFRVVTGFEHVDDEQRRYRKAMREVRRAPTPHSAHTFFAEAHGLCTTNRRRHVTAHLGMARQLAKLGDNRGSIHHTAAAIGVAARIRACPR